jgi:hypothetical protein
VDRELKLYKTRTKTNKNSVVCLADLPSSLSIVEKELKWFINSQVRAYCINFHSNPEYEKENNYFDEIIVPTIFPIFRQIMDRNPAFWLGYSFHALHMYASTELL